MMSVRMLTNRKPSPSCDWCGHICEEEYDVRFNSNGDIFAYHVDCYALIEEFIMNYNKSTFEEEMNSALDVVENANEDRLRVDRAKKDPCRECVYLPFEIELGLIQHICPRCGEHRKDSNGSYSYS